jgi:hypothetical protein
MADLDPAETPSRNEANDRWASIDRVTRLASLIAIPVVIAVSGWLIQDSLSSRNVSQEYVKLAVSILTQANNPVAPALRVWAADLLNSNSPTRLDPALIKELKSGEATFPRDREKVYSDFNDSLNKAPPETAIKGREFFTRMWLHTLKISLPELKDELRKLGFYKGVADDNFGEDFVAAVKAFQHAHKLVPEDGIFGGDSMTALSDDIDRDGGHSSQ